MRMINETANIDIIFRYKKKHNPGELEGSVKVCSHCGKGKQYRCGRFFTPCLFCSNISKIPKKLKLP